MKKLLGLLKLTSGITNGQLLIFVVFALASIVMNYKAEMKNVDLEWKIGHIKGKLEAKGFSKKEIEDLEKPF